MGGCASDADAAGVGWSGGSPPASCAGSSPLFRPANMVHQMMPMNSNPAPSASSSKSNMHLIRCVCAAIVGSVLLWGCATRPVPRASVAKVAAPAQADAVSQAPAPRPAGAAGPEALAPPLTMTQPGSRWVAVAWSDMPAWREDPLGEAWSAWMRSCQRASAPWIAPCAEARALASAPDADKRAWMQGRLQPYRVESAQGEARGLLTAYFEPVFEASRSRSPAFSVPLYQPPAQLRPGQPWFSRKEIDTLAQAQAALQGRVIAYMADPLDALALQIQGSGRMQIRQSDGSLRQSRLAFAGSNGQPYQSVGKWLSEQGLLADTSWPGIKAWAARNPARVNDLLSSNPRVVFFKEEALPGDDSGPRGAQGVPLTAGRSIAVDPASIPYGTPVWISSSGAQTTLQKLVVAQDTGSAITGAVRADYFVGTGAAAGELAGRLKQPLQMWVLWPQ